MRKKMLPIAASIAATAVGAMLATPSALAATSPEPTPSAGRLIAAAEPVPGRYIVVLKDAGLTKSAVKERSKELTSKHGGQVRFTYGTVLKGYAAAMSAEDARQTAADPRVAYVQQDGISHSSDTQTNPPWGLDRIDQRTNTLDQNYTYPNTASNVTAYIVDSGIRIGHTQFEGRASIGGNFASDAYNQTCMSHGTHVAGTVAGKDFGVAKKAKIVSVRVLDCTDNAYDSDIIKAANWITEQAAQDSSRRAVVNMSINSSQGNINAAQDQALKNSIAKGVTWVVSSGNKNSDACQNSPGNIKEAIVVNNATKSDQRRSDSNYGSCTDLFAPGTDILSAAPGSDTATTVMTGTSMAAPHVTGAAALYLSANPTATPAQVQTAIINNATSGVIGDTQGSPNKLLYIGGGTTTPPTGPRFENTNDYAISDNATVTSPVAVTGVSGNAPSALSVTVDIRHTFRGDLKVELVAPDGSAYLLKDYNSNDSADNVQATYTVDASSEVANGTWKLRVTDNWANDTGYINAWSLQF
ncbi:S8 family serine peptidase [Streptomyces sp. NPDC017095]|uniref:S8 family serine peptidase n=1 Tax=Streptomyces sp. NPDC017095 TaxID=3364977 RepID=UPI0037BDF2B8